MALREFKDYPDTATPVDSENLNYNFKEIFNLVFPIGKVEIFFDNEDHSNFMGFTWERTSIGKVPVGIDTSDTDFNTIGKTGGEKTHKLTIDEMPKHRHEMIMRNTGTNAYNQPYPPYTASGDTTNSSAGMLYAGGDQPHNIIQPYEVMAFWKRIS